jgi:uncharacterized protein (TIGR02302 family)
MRAERRDGRGPDPLARVLHRTRAAMALESFTRAFWPVGAALAVLWAALAFGLAEILTRSQLIGVLAVAGLGLAVLLVAGLRRFRWPRLDAARARIDAGLPGRPLAALRDTPALGRNDPGAQAVWAAHMARMRRIAAQARAVPADLRLAARDPWALRLMALVLLLAAVVFARDPGVGSVQATLRPDPAAAVASGPAFEGWAEPPAYTGRPTLYLPEVSAEAPVPVPQGTVVTIRVYGDAARFGLEESVSPAPAPLGEAAPGIATATLPVEADGSVTLSRGGETLGSWSFAVEPDAPPTIALEGGLERAANGETRLAYEASDDHGITAARAEITLDLARVERRYGLAAEPEERPALVADLPMPMSGGTRQVEQTLVEDFSKHPFAGLPVKVRLAAEDAVGQTGESMAIEATLPMRSFYDPLALALVEQRRDLLWSGGNAERVTRVLKAVTNRPDAIFDSPSAYLVVRTATRRLDAAERASKVAEVRDEVAEALWQAAVQIEDGNLGDAAARLARAKERLEQALENGADDEEIARLMDELREATRDYMKEMARNAIEKGQQQEQAEIPPDQMMTQDQIQELMDRIQELSEQGRKEEARQLLEMLQQMLENMQMMVGQGQGQQGEGSEGQQSMQGLADALREQQGLADDSFQQLQREFRDGRPGQGGQGGQQSPNGPRAEGEGEPGGEQSLADRQEALRQLMEDLQQNLPGAAGEAAREALREAERDMGEARDGLDSGDTSGALDRQADAIDSLREGMRAMGEDMRNARAPQNGDQGQVAGESNSENGRDPLGRPFGSRGSIGSNEHLLPDGDLAARARQLLDEIRRRAGEQDRPKIELDYLRRLLDLF